MTWTRDDTTFPCPRCHARAGARCRTFTGHRTSGPHTARLAPRYLCPECAWVEANAHNVAARFCSRCGRSTGPVSLPVQPALALGAS